MLDQRKSFHPRAQTQFGIIKTPGRAVLVNKTLEIIDTRLSLIFSIPSIFHENSAPEDAEVSMTGAVGADAFEGEVFHCSKIVGDLMRNCKLTG
jgi:hypothetical protein